jgi:hypothetical protein
VGFELNIPASERAKTVHALDRATTVTGNKANLLDDNTDTIKKSKETLIDAFKEVGLEVNTDKLSVCCCLVTRIQNKIMT